MSKKQVVGRVLWERCEICNLLTNCKAMKAKPCKSKELCTAKLIGGIPKTTDVRIQERINQNNPNLFMEWVTL